MRTHKPQQCNSCRRLRRSGYLPPYSPDFNPIEQCWSKINLILRILKACTAEALEQAVAQTLAAIAPDNARAWFAKFRSILLILYINIRGQLQTNNLRLNTSASAARTT